MSQERRTSDSLQEFGRDFGRAWHARALAGIAAALAAVFFTAMKLIYG